MTVPGVSEGERTADEVIRAKEGRLRDDPEYRAQVEAVESARRERVRALRDAEQPILQDLRATGIDVGSVWDLVNTAEPYEAELPILVEHLERGTYPDRVLESLGRAVKPARQYW